MKLRFKGNTLRLRLNQKEVGILIHGQALRETVAFPGDTSLTYCLASDQHPAASLSGNVIRIAAPADALSHWAAGNDIGLYFDFPATPTPLKVAIEKDLECVDGPPEDRDLDAYPRLSGKNC